MVEHKDVSFEGIGKSNPLLDEIIQELGEYDERRARFLALSNSATSLSNEVDVKALHLEDLVKIQDEQSSSSRSNLFQMEQIVDDGITEYAEEMISDPSALAIYQRTDSLVVSNTACGMEIGSDSDGTDEEEKKSEKNIRKKKNNEASKVHRAKKKEKYQDLFKRENELKAKNTTLKVQVESMEKELEYLRELLLVKVAVSSKPS